MYWETWSISRSATCWTYSPGRGRSATNSLRGACTASLRSKSIPYTITSSKNGRRPGNRQSVRRQSQCIPLPEKLCEAVRPDLFGRALRSGGQRRGHPAGTGTRFTQTGWVSRFRTFEKHKFFVRPSLLAIKKLRKRAIFFLQKVRKSLEIQIFVLPLHSQSANGVVVQLVRIPACHAGGRGFESRPYRKISKQMIAKPCKVYLQGFFLFLYPKKGSKCSPKAANNQRKSPPYFVLEAFSYCTLNLTSHRLLE